MKKILALFLFVFLALSSFALAKDNIKVTALSDYDSSSPKENFKAKLAEDGQIDGIYMIKGDILNCELIEIKDPTRAKRDAKIFFKLISYEDSKGTHYFKDNYAAKYAKTVLSKEEIEKIPPKTMAKKTARTVGNFFVSGFSYAFSFVDGAKENKENNRLKSGAKQAYKDSFFSYVEYGNEVQIKKGDEFYFQVKKYKED